MYFSNRKFKEKKSMFKTSAETNGFSWVLDKFISEKNKRMWSTPADNGWLAVSYATWNRVSIRNRELPFVFWWIFSHILIQFV